MSPPTVRFAIDTTINPFGLSPKTRKRSPPLLSRSIQHSGSNSSLGQQQNSSKLIFDTSPIKTRQKLTDIDSKYYLFDIRLNLFC